MPEYLSRAGIGKTGSLSDRNQLTKQNLLIRSIYLGDGNVEKGMNMIGPFPFSIFLDNRREYVRRFSHLKEQTYTSQSAYFCSMLQYLKQLGTDVIVVNMPMLPPVRDLLPKTLQNDYLRDLTNNCLSNQVYLLNLAPRKEYSQHYFIDYVHLNAGGGKILINQLSDFISSNDRLRADITYSAGGLSSRR